VRGRIARHRQCARRRASTRGGLADLEGAAAKAQGYDTALLDGLANLLGGELWEDAAETRRAMLAGLVALNHRTENLVVVSDRSFPTRRTMTPGPAPF
jgi:adenosyl cobinamide kinase/adenosyl cobinamide phosphate guanylyltransferase